MVLKVGQKVRIKCELASGPFEGDAVVRAYHPPPPQVPDFPPSIWVRPKGWTHDLGITLACIVQTEG
jgi:hypothetical protein